MKTIDDINLYTWFMERELDYVPPHFTVSKVRVTTESKLWILENLVGRYSFGTPTFADKYYPAFEDPKEALFYDLKWS